MNERRIERLTRELSGPPRPAPVAWTPLEEQRLENLVRVVAIVVLVLLVFTFATWPRDDDGPQPPVRAEQPTASHALPAPSIWPGAAVRVGRSDYSPLY